MNINWGLTAALTLQASGALLLLVLQLTEKGQRKEEPAKIMADYAEETAFLCMDKTEEEEREREEFSKIKNRFAFSDLLAGYLISALLTNSTGGCCTFMATLILTVAVTGLEYFIASKCSKGQMIKNSPHF